MKILSIECSAGPASAAVVEDGRVLASAFVNIKSTHSQTLMPMIRQVLTLSGTDLRDCGIAVAAGPGSFTGIRIGISALKGLAAADRLPCVGVSTLRAMAESYRDRDTIVCAVMDARCNQVYNALFRIENGKIERLCEDRALLCDDLREELSRLDRGDLPITVTGDGTELFAPYVSALTKVVIAEPDKRYQNAVGVALAALPEFISGNTVSAAALMPVYLRLPQAERELKKKQEGTKSV